MTTPDLAALRGEWRSVVHEAAVIGSSQGVIHASLRRRADDVFDRLAAGVRVTGEAGLEPLDGVDCDWDESGKCRCRVTGDGLREAAQALVDWYDGPPYVYVEGEMEERIYAIKEALGPKMCGSCGHPGHWRECKAIPEPVGCACRHRGPHSEAPKEEPRE